MTYLRLVLRSSLSLQSFCCSPTWISETVDPTASAVFESSMLVSLGLPKGVCTSIEVSVRKSSASCSKSVLRGVLLHSKHLHINTRNTSVVLRAIYDILVMRDTPYCGSLDGNEVVRHPRRVDTMEDARKSTPWTVRSVSRVSRSSSSTWLDCNKSYHFEYGFSKPFPCLFRNIGATYSIFFH